jgi:hypothetical protein
MLVEDQSATEASEQARAGAQAYGDVQEQLNRLEPQQRYPSCTGLTRASRRRP